MSARTGERAAGDRRLAGRRPVRGAAGRIVARRSLDARKRHQVTLTFLLYKQISPQALAQKLVSACGGGALMPGEGILGAGDKIACIVTDETLSLPCFGFEWYRMPREARRPRSGGR